MVFAYETSPFLATFVYGAVLRYREFYQYLAYRQRSLVYLEFTDTGPEVLVLSLFAAFLSHTH